jgi:capsular exopolysaccharide synthesis family protein
LLVLLRDQLDDRVRVPEDIDEKVRLPMLGVIPRVLKQTPLEALGEVRSPLSEAYSSLAGSLMYSTREGLPDILLITSAQPTEGKSITSFASANALARLGKSVILIDSDLRRPSIHGLAKLENKQGLSSVLVSNDDPAQYLRPSGQDNLAIMTSGPMPPNPSDLLGSPRMAAVLEQLSERCDVVVIDSSPVLGLADAPLIAGLADAVVFVVESDRGRSGSLKSALRRLRNARANLVGAVLTKFDPAKSGNRFSQYYGYDYYRYDSDGPKEISG